MAQSRPWYFVNPNDVSSVIYKRANGDHLGTKRGTVGERRNDELRHWLDALTRNQLATEGIGPMLTECIRRLRRFTTGVVVAEGLMRDDKVSDYERNVDAVFYGDGEYRLLDGSRVRVIVERVEEKP